MDKLSTKTLRILAVIALAFNIAILASQLHRGEFAGTELSDAKAFANDVISNLQELAATLNVSEKNSVKQSLAKLHYDVFLVNSHKELADILQNDAAKTRDLIISEYTNLTAEKVLAVLNAAPEIQYSSSSVTLTLEPLPTGGYEVKNPHNLEEDTLNQLLAIENLFSKEAQRGFYEPYRHLSTLKVLIENGVAQLIPQSLEQETIKYLEGEIENLRQEYARINQMAGYAEMSGPGIEIYVYDQIYTVSAGDLRRIISELYSAGARGIAIHGQRLSVNSYIIDSEEGIVVDGVTIRSNPVIIQVVGDTTTLKAGVDLLFSVSFRGVLGFDIENRENMVLPAKAFQ
ncbi:MAG TPA: DUF881 domain-containing protein [Bacillota bacterium]|nr:DUF881 domain-containing protein [Bacillota bacterium]HPZ21532.1 DUF881 domain-containing protein [Bacillota bacterium]HQD19601.1 DUF881 domain-containing protein [Bacillota bacterium]